ncbi:MAG: hypothetical protein GY866_40505 [Proteobacteria bacterium]|nr:hypothetical protein [Pseudomonadota bacterium]
MEKEKTLTVKVKLPFRYAVGATASRFFKELRDDKRIFGTECPSCKEVLVPARSFCSRCNRKTENWVELGHTGNLVGWTGGDNEETIACLVRLEGANTLFLHRLSNFAETELKEGLAVEVVWQEKRTGSINDIAFFQPR